MAILRDIDRRGIVLVSLPFGIFAYVVATSMFMNDRIASILDLSVFAIVGLIFVVSSFRIHAHMEAASFLFSLLTIGWIPAAVIVGTAGFENGGNLDHLVSGLWTSYCWMFSSIAVILAFLRCRQSTRAKIAIIYALSSLAITTGLFVRGFHTKLF